jgi:hypothetical protein
MYSAFGEKSPDDTRHLVGESCGDDLEGALAGDEELA